MRESTSKFVNACAQVGTGLALKEMMMRMNQEEERDLEEHLENGWWEREELDKDVLKDELVVRADDGQDRRGGGRPDCGERLLERD